MTLSIQSGDASNFVAHGHDPDGCDLIVCWEDDLGYFKVDRLELRALVASLHPPLIESPNRVKYPPQDWTQETFIEKSPPELRQAHRDFLDWAAGFAPLGRVAFAEENQFPSWSFAARLATGKKITLFGLWADGTVWVQPRGLPDGLGELYRGHLGKAVNEINLGKQWFLRQNGIADPNFLAVVKEAVGEVLKNVA